MKISSAQKVWSKKFKTSQPDSSSAETAAHVSPTFPGLGILFNTCIIFPRFVNQSAEEYFSCFLFPLLMPSLLVGHVLLGYWQGFSICTEFLDLMFILLKAINLTV